MNITKKEKDKFVLDVIISLERPELEKYVEQAKSELAQHVKMDGFRKGRAPKDLVDKQLDPAMVRQEALEHALGDSFTKAAAKEGWDVMRTSDLKIVKNDANGLEYSVNVQLWPPIVMPALDTIKVERKAIQVGDAEIQEALDTVLNMRATFLDKTGPAATGDRVEIDFDASIGGKAVEGAQSRNHPLIIGGRNFMPGFEEALVGLSSGDKKEFTIVAPDDYYEPKLAGQKMDFVVTMHRVQTVLKPSADDAFAKSLGRFENLDQLKGNLREGIYNEKNVKEQQRLRLAILDDIISKSDIAVPAALTKEELDGMVQRFSDDLRGRGMDMAMYLARLKKDEEDLRKDWQKEAERQVRIRLILRQVAKEKSISVRDEELDAAVKDAIGELMSTGQLTEGQVDPERVRQAIAERILTAKTLDFIEGVCTASLAPAA